MITTYLTVYEHHFGIREQYGSYKDVQCHLLPTSKTPKLSHPLKSHCIRLDSQIYNVHRLYFIMLFYAHNAVELFPDDYAKCNAFRKRIF